MHRVNSLLKAGHYSDHQRKTGLTVFIPNKRSSCAYFLCGGAPALREVSTLDISLSNKIDALLFSGGSCFGLGAANGVMNWLAERKRGIKIGKTIIPIVPTACIFDEGIYKLNSYPSDKNAYEACKNAQSATVDMGRVGAGTGATVGKLISNTNPQYGGFGYSFMSTGNSEKDAWVIAYAVVNAVGNIFENSCSVVTGAIDKNSEFVNHIDSILPLYKTNTANTSLIAIFTNAKLCSKSLSIIATMASTGMAKSISPCFTPYDGDVVFAVTLDNIRADVTDIGIMASEVTKKAILNAVKK